MNRRSLKRTNRILYASNSRLHIDVSTSKHKNAVMIIMKNDYLRIKSMGAGRITAFNRACMSGVGIYAICKINNKIHYIHRLILNNPAVVDHIDGDGLNNSIENLRPCSHRQNAMNCGVSKNNNSGTTGVAFKKDTGKWRARIMVNRSEINLGHFDEKTDAVTARKEAEKKYFGEFARAVAL